MAINLNNIEGGGKKFDRPEPLEAGTYPARVVQIISLGLQEQRPYKGDPKPPRNDLMVVYELADEFLLDEDGNEDETKPRWVRERFPLHPLDSDLAISTKRYTALDPDWEKKGDILATIGTPCLVQLSRDKSNKDESVYNNIRGVTAMRSKDAAKAVPLVNPTTVFDHTEPDQKAWDTQPKWIQDIIKVGLEYEGSSLQAFVEGTGKTDKKEDKNEKEPATEEDDSAEW